MSNELIPVRLSHVLGQSGVGAIVRGANGLVVVQDIRHWTDRQGAPAGRLIPYVERARAALGISQELREPPIAKELSNERIDGACLPATRLRHMISSSRFTGRVSASRFTKEVRLRRDMSTTSGPSTAFVGWGASGRPLSRAF